MGAPILLKKYTSIQKSTSHKKILKSQAKEEATSIYAQTHPTWSHEHVLFEFSNLNYIDFSNLIYIFDLNYVPNLSYVFQFELYYIF